MKMLHALLMAVSLTMSAGCNNNWYHGRSATVESEYKTVASDPTRNTQLAKEYNTIAIKALKDGDIDEAERRLQDALASDVFFGPAHNNLGHVYFVQKKYYLAAWEFQYAAKLMPNNAEPKNNLAMVLEAAGKPADAVKYYKQALAIQPDNPELIANLARVYVKQKQNTPQTRELLNEIVLKDARSDWTCWASEQLASKNFHEGK
jgi:Flp pilus assembly protein TadD